MADSTASQPVAHPPLELWPDGCPECVVNVEEPCASERVGDEVTCLYRCSDCGHRWSTSRRD